MKELMLQEAADSLQEQKFASENHSVVLLVTSNVGRTQEVASCYPFYVSMKISINPNEELPETWVLLGPESKIRRFGIKTSSKEEVITTIKKLFPIEKTHLLKM